jgi:hypothetical protein
MNRYYLASAATLLMLPPALVSHPAFAHGFAGDRFFPATLLTDDPFVADEMSLPSVTRNPTGIDGAQETDIDVDIAKRITPDIGITLGNTWKYVQPNGQPAVTGRDALRTGVQYQLFIDGPTESMALVGLQLTWGHTGRVQALGAPDFTTLTPTFDFGKGFGDLPNSVAWLRPFAVTGNLSFDFPTKTESAGNPNPNIFNAGFAIEYSLEYLQHHVRDVGLIAPFDRMIPLVEVAFSTGLNRGAAGQTTGTVQPGVIWAGKYYQIGAEAIVPMNSGSGHGIGGIVQLHFFLDDLFPTSIGRPLFSY